MCLCDVVCVLLDWCVSSTRQMSAFMCLCLCLCLGVCLCVCMCLCDVVRVFLDGYVSIARQVCVFVCLCLCLCLGVCLCVCVCLCDVVCVLMDGCVFIARQVCVFVSVSGCVSVPGCVSLSLSGCVGCCVRVDGWVCVSITRQVCVRAHMYSTSYTHTLAGSRRKGRCMTRLDTSATTIATRDGVASAGAHPHEDDALLEFITRPSPSNTYTQSHTASIGKRCMGCVRLAGSLKS